MCLQFDATAPDFQKFPVLVKASEVSIRAHMRVIDCLELFLRLIASSDPIGSNAFFITKQAEKNFLAREEKAAAAGAQKEDVTESNDAAAEQTVVSRPFSGQSVLPDISGRRLKVCVCVCAFVCVCVRESLDS